jgi:uncharacterized membrane protein YidH (DUF202 family)
MKEFLRENWLYIAVPLVVVLVVLIGLLLFGGDSASPFIYNV